MHVKLKAAKVFYISQVLVCNKFCCLAISHFDLACEVEESVRERKSVPVISSYNFSGKYIVSHEPFHQLLAVRG